MIQLPRSSMGDFCPLGPDLAAAVPPDNVIFDADTTAALITGRIRHFASGLAAAGVRVGMRIGLHLPAGAERLSVMLAVTTLGAVAVPLDPALGQARLTIARQGAELDMVIEGGVALPATARAGLRILKIGDLTPDPVPLPLPRPQPDTAAVVLFGQGARDSGRAVILSHGALHAAALGLIRRFGLTGGLRLHVPLSFNHALRLVAEIACLISGATLTEIPQGADIALLADNPPQFGPENAPKTILTSATPREMRALTRRFPDSRVFNAYARAEICGLALTSDPRDPTHTAITTVGRPLPGVEVMIVDPRTGFDMLLYEVGEIWLRGPMVMSGYDHAPRASAQAVDRTGFFHTGDMGYLDSEGRVILSVNHAQI